MAVASLVLGILGLVLVWIPGVGLLVLPLGVIGLLLGRSRYKDLRRIGEDTRLALAGTVTSAVSLAAFALVTIWWGQLIFSANEAIDDAIERGNNARVEEERRADEKTRIAATVRIGTCEVGPDGTVTASGTVMNPLATEATITVRIIVRGEYPNAARVDPVQATVRTVPPGRREPFQASTSAWKKKPLSVQCTIKDADTAGR